MSDPSQSPPDALTIPPAPVDGVMLPAPLSFRMHDYARVLRAGCNPLLAALIVASFADEAEALEARVRTGRTRP